MAATQNPTLVLSKVAGGEVTAYRCVDFSGLQCANAGGKVLGVAQTKAAVGDAYSVAVSGVVIIEAGGAIAAGAGLVTDAEGRAVVADSLSATRAPIVGTLIAGTGTVDGVDITGGEVTLSGGETPSHVFADALSVATGAGEKISALMRR